MIDGVSLDCVAFKCKKVLSHLQKQHHFVSTLDQCLVHFEKGENKQSIELESTDKCD